MQVGTTETIALACGAAVIRQTASGLTGVSLQLYTTMGSVFLGHQDMLNLSVLLENYYKGDQNE